MKRGSLLDRNPEGRVLLIILVYFYIHEVGVAKVVWNHDNHVIGCRLVGAKDELVRHHPGAKGVHRKDVLGQGVVVHEPVKSAKGLWGVIGIGDGYVCDDEFIAGRRMVDALC